MTPWRFWNLRKVSRSNNITEGIYSDDPMATRPQRKERFEHHF
jgi:hypothetical protein